MTVPAALPQNDAERVGALRALDILDSEPEAAFNEIALLASSICQAPIALVSFVDQNRQWFKARINMNDSEMPRDMAFCSHAILGDDVMIVRDATKDPRFATNPLVTGDPLIRSYAGAPLIDQDGFKLGTICAIHTKTPIELSDSQIGQLRHLGKITSAILVARQHSQIRVREQKKKTEWLELSSQVAKIGYWTIDVASREIFWSDEQYRIYGSSPAHYVPEFESGINFYHPDDRDYIRSCINKAIATQSPCELEARMVRADGEVRIIHGKMICRFDDHGDVVELFGISQDVTELKQAQEAAQRSQKMEAIGQLTGGIAHDFNNLLAVMMGNIELLEEDPDHPKRHEFIHSALRSAHRGAQLTHQLLAFGRRTLLKPTVLNLNDILREMDGLLRRTIPETIEIHISLADGLEDVLVDPGQIENALLNLTINARDSMAGGGKLSIETANIHLEKEHTLSRDESLEPGHYAMIAITDTGVGIPANVLPKVFDPFFTTKKTGEGSGLGLSMVHGFVKQSGGTVRIYSEVGIGTTVILYFKASEFSKAAEDDTITETPLDTGRNERILVVEDEDDVREIIVMQLQSLGYDVTEARDGAMATDILRHKGAFDLLLTDIVMPDDLQGPDVAREARAMDPELKVIFMSGYPNEAAIDGKGLRSEDIQLMKPVSRSHLARTIHNVLRADA